MTDESEMIGGAIIANLSKMFNKQINEDGIEPLVIVRALLSVAGNIGGATHSSHVR